MKLITPRRALDERSDRAAGKLHRVQVVPVGSPVKVVNVSIAVVTNNRGYLSDRVGTSFMNYSEVTRNVVLDMPVQPDGTIIFGSTTNVHCVVDVRGEGQ